jgi:HSP20 family protein
MTTLTRWNPLAEVEELREQVDSWLKGRSNDEAGQLMEWAPNVDIAEDEQEYLIKAELPGVKKQDLNVTYENGVLTLTGERKEDREEKTRRYHRLECSYGKFTRSFTLPEDIEPDKIEAEFKDGVLWVHVTKSEKARPKQIPVKVN